MLSVSMAKHHKQVADARNKIEKYRSFLNPLSHMICSIGLMLERAKELDASLVKSRKHPESLEEMQWHVENHPKQSMAATELSSCCLSVRMMSPVVAEMFINLIIFNLFKSEGKDCRQKALFTRSSIVDRVAELYDKCRGFASRPDVKSEPVRGFFALMERRNHLLHGNIKPEDKVEGDFQVHDGVPTITKFRSMFDRALGPTINAFPLQEAEKDYQAALEFINYLQSCLDEKWKAEYELMKESIDLHYGVRCGEVRALYGNDFHESVDPDLLPGDGPLPDWLV
jgi:hypothetical protein